MTTCDSCKAFHAKSAQAGDCRRHAPVVQGQRDNAAWPFVSRQQWCLDHVPVTNAESSVFVADEFLYIGQRVTRGNSCATSPR